jgi:predicted transcriptional regulator with HTH domain
MLTTNINYNPNPTRVWSRVQNSCTTNQNNTNIKNDIIYIPLTNQLVTPKQSQIQTQMVQKGNILQYKNNSANFTKSQKYSRISQGFTNARKKCYATQSEVYTNPNTSSLLRVNYATIPYPNQLVGTPNNISGPYQTDVPNPFDCSSNLLQDGGNLVCNAIVNPCSGEIIQTYKSSIEVCYPNSCSDVPGAPIDLCWYPSIQTWYPRQRYIMNNSLNKWPEGYKGLVSAVTPAPPILTLVLTTPTYTVFSWAIVVSLCLPISSFNFYVNNVFYENILNNKLFTTKISNLILNLDTNSVYITALSTTVESVPSNIVYVNNSRQNTQKQNGTGTGIVARTFAIIDSTPDTLTDAGSGLDVVEIRSVPPVETETITLAEPLLAGSVALALAESPTPLNLATRNITTTCAGLIEPTRVWSRVQNSCTINQNNTNIENDIVYIPLTDQYVTRYQSQEQAQMFQKGNILQYKNNSANFTKSQKYSRISQGFVNTRRKSYATQSEVYTNPNTSSLLRVNYTNIPYPNQLVGSPNNISGPYQTDVASPFDCSTNLLQDGGNLVCNAIVNPCSGEITQTYKSSLQVCYPSSCSDVPGAPIDLCWYPGVQTWYPRQRYTMNNSLNKWPQGYKGFVNAVTPEPPVLTLVLTTSSYAVISWAIVVTRFLPINSFNIYVNNIFYENISNNKLFTTRLLNTILSLDVNSVYITAISKNIESKPSNTVYVKKSNQSTQNQNGNGGGTLLGGTNGNGGGTGGTGTGGGATEEGGVVDPTSCTCDYYNNLLNNNTIVEINTYLLHYLSVKYDPTDVTYINLDTYNMMKIRLIQLSELMDKNCCFYNIIEIYKNILDAIKNAFDVKLDLQSQMIGCEQYKQDSKILHDPTLLKDYITQLNNSMLTLFSINIQSPLLNIKPQYAIYHERYGIPSNLEYDPELLEEILEELVN